MTKYLSKAELVLAEAEAKAKGWTLWTIRYDAKTRLYEVFIDFMD